MEQYRGLYKHIEEVVENLGQFKLFCYFFTWDWTAKLAKISPLNMLPLLCHGRGSLTLGWNPQKPLNSSLIFKSTEVSL